MATTSAGRRSRIVAASAAATALTLGVAACGSGGGSPEKLTGANLTRAVNQASDELRRGELADAQDSFEEILKSDATNALAHYNLGYIAQIQGDRGEAEKQYRAAIETDPKFTSALYNLAIVVTGDDVDKAISLYRRAIKSNKNDANSHYNLGLLLRQQGKTAEGNSQIRTAVELNPALAPQAAAQRVPPR